MDAIMGAPKQLHQIIEAYCTGCEDCTTVCPVDCISMQPMTYLPKERIIKEEIGAARTAAVQEKQHAIKQKKQVAPNIEQIIQDDLAQILKRAQQKRASKHDA